ncbi:MAG: hypothetical protein R3F35_22380 [Myxococcota bacterium]
MAELDRHPFIGMPTSPSARDGVRIPGIALVLDVLVLERIDRRRPRDPDRNELAEGHESMTRADPADILAIVVEVAVGEPPVLVPDRPIGADLPGIEFGLDLHVTCDGHERRARLVDQHPPRLRRRVAVGVVPVAVIGELFHAGIVEMAPAEGRSRQEDAALALRLGQIEELRTIGDPDVEVPVRREHDSIDPVRIEVAARDLIVEPDPLGACRRAAGLQAVEGRQNPLPPVTAGRLQRARRRPHGRRWRPDPGREASRRVPA